MQKIFSSRAFRYAVAACLATILSCVSYPGQAQTNNFEILPGQEFVQSPQVWGFMKYGNSPASLYTGTVSTSIPIYTYQDPDLEIPISLEYSSNGFIANTLVNEIGLGWFLNAAGAVTREVRGRPDNTAIRYNDPDQRCGYYKFHLYCKENNITPSPSIFDRVVGHDNRLCLPFPIENNRTDYAETESDLYHFKFGNHSGSFVLDYGTIRVFNANHPVGEYRVAMTIEPNTGKTPITIQTSDGYIYEFGKHSNVGSCPDDNYQINDHKTAYFGTEHNRAAHPGDAKEMVWRLTSITTSNGRRVEFKYAGDQTLVTYKPYYTVNNTSTVAIDGMGNANMSQNNNFKCSTARNEQHAPYLDYILIDDKVKITFDYENRQNEICGFSWQAPQEINTFDYFTPKRLKEIRVADLQNDRELKRCTLYHSYSTVGNKKMFLDKVTINGIGSYEMEYDGKTTKYFPYQGSASYDRWGYYNGGQNYNFNHILPDAILHRDNTETVTNFRTRYTNPDGARIGMLTKITYPTKGYSTFHYEPHTFRKQVVRAPNYTYLPELSFLPVLEDVPLAEGTIAGGLRIKKIIDVAPGNDSTWREFIYSNSHGSTGILLNYPRFYKYSYVVNDNDQLPYYVYATWKSSDGLIAFSTDKTHIEYASILEKSSDGSYTEYCYSNYADSPAPIENSSYVHFSLYCTPSLTEQEEYCLAEGGGYDGESQKIRNLFSEPVTQFDERGRLLSKTMYNSNGQKVYREANTYSPAPSYYTEGVRFAGYQTYRYAHRTYCDTRTLDEVRTIRYFGNDSMVTTSKYTYNPARQIKTIETTDPQGIITLTKNQYASDEPVYADSLRERIRGIMAEMNYPQPTRTQTTVQTPWDQDGPTLVSANRYNYRRHQYIYQEYLLFENPTLISEARLKEAVQNYSGDFNFDNLLEVEYTYDYNGYVRRSTIYERDGKRVYYIWGYGGLYPVARIVSRGANASYYDRMTCIGNLTQGQKDTLRALPDAMVDLYDYIPYVGIKEHTDPSGRKMFYDYDVHGRLIGVKDDQGNLVNSYEYNFKSF